MNKTPVENLGTITGIGESRRVELVRLYPFAIEKVWQAITDPELVAQWFADFTIDPIEGGRIELNFGKVLVTGSIKTMMPPYVFSYTWEQDGETTSIVQFDLMRMSENETHLTIIQTGLDAEIAPDVGLGWHSMMDRLAVSMHTEKFEPQDKNQWKPLHEAYKELDQANN